MLNKVIIISGIAAFIALIGLISTLGVWNHNLSKENAKLKSELANVNTLIDIQNKQILQDKLDLETYKNSQVEVKDKIITRYINIDKSKGDSECEKELNIIKEALKVYYER